MQEIRRFCISFVIRHSDFVICLCRVRRALAVQLIEANMAEFLWQLGGWTMLQFLWIGTIVAVVGGGVRMMVRRGSPAVRYAASLATLAALAMTPAGIAGWLALDSPAILAGRAIVSPAESQSTAVSPSQVAAGDSPSQDGSAIYATALPRVVDLAYEEPPIASTESPAADDSSVADVPQNFDLGSGESLDSPSPLLFLHGMGAVIDIVVAKLPWAWLIGAPATFALLATGLVGSERLRRSGTAIASGPVFEACERMRKAMHITRRVSVALCEGVAQPVLVGIVRPLILLPASAISGWTPEEVEMVLVHELAHVRRWDNLVNLAQRIVESLLFFHPAVWLASRQVRRDREECCDAVVVARTAQPQRYAELLVSIATTLRRGQTGPLIAASAMADHPLAGRIRRILKLEDEPMKVTGRTLSATCLTAIILLGLSIYAAGFAGAEPPATEADATSTADVAVAATHADESSEKHAAEAPAPPAPQAETPNEKPAEPSERLDELNLAAIAARNFIDPEVEAPRLRAEITRLETLISDANKELVSLEVFKQLALGQARSTAALEAMIAKVVEKDPTIQSYQAELVNLQKALIARQQTVRNPNDSQMKRLQQSLEQTQTELSQHRAAVEKSAREQIAKMPNETLRQAIIEHRIRYEAAKKNLAKYEEDLKEANRKVELLSGGGAQREAADEPLQTRVYPVGDVESVRFRDWMRLITNDPAITLVWDDDNQSVLISAPLQSHERIAEFLKNTRDQSAQAVKGTVAVDGTGSVLMSAPTDGGDDRLARLQAKIKEKVGLFEVADDNPVKKAVYKKDKIRREYDDHWHYLIKGLNERPGLKSFVFNWNNKSYEIEIEAPVKAHEQLFAPMSAGADLLAGDAAGSGLKQAGDAADGLARAAGAARVRRRASARALRHTVLCRRARSQR
jgi:beta-lactamase regulating signal transducer with metallopeptidase domain